MAKMTITEALSEVNLIKKKIEKKAEFLKGNTARPEHLKDMFEADGGSLVKNGAEIQAVDDLYARLVKIRSAIAQANLANEITLNEKTMPIQDWLTWKREVATNVIGLTQAIHKSVKRTLDDAMTQPKVYKDEQGNTHLLKVVPCFDYAGLIKKEENLTALLEQLDGKLSLKNATILVDV